MKTILKGVLVLFVLTLILDFMPGSQAMADETVSNKEPAFTVTVPSWNNSTKSRNPNSIARKVADPDEVTSLEVSVMPLTEEKTFKEVTQDVVAFFEDTYDASDCEILYERNIKLSDGTPAYELEVKWQHPAILLYTYEVVVFKDKKMVTVSMTSYEKIPDKLKKYPLSLTFK